MDTPALLYETDPIRQRELNERLDAQVSLLTHGLAGATYKHVTSYETWSIELKTDELNNLSGITAERGREERGTYSFKNTPEGWQVVGSRKAFARAHFSNIVTMVTRSGLAWERPLLSEQPD
jgi:hypothetical protein